MRRRGKRSVGFEQSEPGARERKDTWSRGSREGVGAGGPNSEDGVGAGARERKDTWSRGSREGVGAGGPNSEDGVGAGAREKKDAVRNMSMKRRRD